MSNLWTVLTFCAALMTVGPAHAGSATALLALFQGSTLKGEYRHGGRFTERFRADGTTRYQDANILADGTVRLNGNALCFTYESDRSFPGGCFTVEQRGANCFGFYADSSTATPFQRKAGLGWDARAWRMDQPGTCKAAVIS